MDGEVELEGPSEASFGFRLPDAPEQGVYAGWELAGDRLVVRNDRFGFFPLFYRRDGARLSVSPSLLELVRRGGPVSLDAEALAVFFRLGFFLGDDTCFSEIRTVPPDARFVWRRGELEAAASLRTGGIRPVSRDDAIDAYQELFARAMERRLPAAGEPFGVPLTGGRDSRHIVLELHRRGLRPRFCVTSNQYPPRASVDVENARRLCRELSWEHTELDPLPRFRAERMKNERTHFLSDEHAWLMGTALFLEGRIRTYYDGTGAGDVISAGYFIRKNRREAELCREGRFREAAEVLLGPAEESLERTLLSADPATMSRPVALRRVARELERFGDAPSPITMFYFWNRTRREVGLAPYGILRGIPVVHCPYLDHDLFDFLASLPRELLEDGRLHTETIARAYPRFEQVPYAIQGRVPDWGHYLPFTARVLGHAIRTNPRWFRKNAPLVLGWARSAVDRKYRKEHKMLLSPARLLYSLELENLLAGADSCRRS